MNALSPLARIVTEPIDLREVEGAVWTQADGAVVTFTGIVRDHDGGRVVDRLEYSAHPRAEKFLQELCAEVAGDFSRVSGGRCDGSVESVVRLAAVHRIGDLEIGDVAVTVVAAAPHRREAFKACQMLIDRLKQEVPIWKRQLFAEGLSEWVGSGEC